MMNKLDETTRPAARETGLIVQEMAEEVLIYDQERQKAHCLNQTAALVWRHSDGKTTVAQMARLLEKEMQSPVAEGVVWMALEQLSKAQLMNERAAPLPSRPALSRRELIRRAGLGAAVALPLVSSIVAPRAAQAATLLPPGACCSSSGQCSSGVCNPSPSCSSPPKSCA
jgi:hypothetical protein